MKLKIVILSTYDSDGSGIFAIQQMKLLQDLGYEAQIVCVKSTSTQDGITGIYDNKAFQYFISKFKRRFFNLFYNPKPEYAFLDTYSINTDTVISSDVWHSKCELIICTFMAEMINPSCLSKILLNFNNPPVIFYGVDMNFFTGGCHYARSCQKYKTNCNHCPAVSTFAQLFVAKNFLQKKQLVSNIQNHIVIASSDEHSRQIKNSKIFRNSDIRKLLMPVDNEVYGCNEKARLKLKVAYGLGKNTLLIRSSAEPRKGGQIFIDCILKLLESKSEFVRGIDIITIGDTFIKNQLDGYGLRIFFHSHISEERELSELYTVADVFINTSLADGGPMMLAQSIMSFTPIITTDVGLARDLVAPGSGSVIIEDPTVNNFAEAIYMFLVTIKDKQKKMRTNARNTAIKLLSKEAYTHKLSKIIDTVVSGKSL